FCVASAGPSLGCDRQLQGPGRLTRHQPDELVRAAEAARGCGYESLRPLGSFKRRNEPVLLNAIGPQQTTRPRSRTAVRAARSMSYQKRLIAGCAARHSALNVFTSSSVNRSGSNFRHALVPPI